MKSIKSIKLFYIFLLFVYLLLFGIFSTIYIPFNIWLLNFHSITIGIATFYYFKIANKDNYFDFDTLFIVLCLIIGFFSFYFYKTDLQVVMIGYIDFPEKYVNSGLSIFSAGIMSYYLGALSYSYKRFDYSVASSFTNRYISNKFLGYVIVLFCIYLLTSDLLAYYQNIYKAQAISSQALKYADFLMWFVIAYVTIECYNNQYKSFKVTRNNFIPLGTVVITSLIIMISGSRTLASYYLLPILSAYFMFERKLSLKWFVIVFCVFSFIMKIIQFTRTGTEVDIQQSVSVVNDITCVSIHTPYVQEYTDSFGYLYCKNILVYLLAIIPGLSSLVFPRMRDVGSAEILTDYIYKVSGWPGTSGLGVNIIADLYLALGPISVIIGMYYLGRLVNKTLKQSYMGSFWGLAMYLSLMAHSAFLPRATYASPAKTIVWSMITLWIIKQLSRKTGKIKR